MNRLAVLGLGIFGNALFLFGMACAAPAVGEVRITDENGARAALRELLKADARNVPYIEITGEMPRDFTLRVVSSFGNEHPSYPICTRYTLAGPSPLSLERYVKYDVTSQTGRFVLSAPLDYAAFKAPLSSFCAPWYHAITRIGIDYLGRRAMLTDLGIVRATHLKNYHKGQPLISPIEIVCSKELLESTDSRLARTACKTTLGPTYGWWFGLTEDFIATMPSVEGGLSAPRPLTIRIQVSN